LFYKTEYVGSTLDEELENRYKEGRVAYFNGLSEKTMKNLSLAGLQVGFKPGMPHI
jgi:hypothetical protein